MVKTVCPIIGVCNRTLIRQQSLCPEWLLFGGFGNSTLIVQNRIINIIIYYIKHSGEPRGSPGVEDCLISATIFLNEKGIQEYIIFIEIGLEKEVREH